MSDDYRISYSYRWDTAPAQRKPAVSPGETPQTTPGLYAFVPGTSLDLPDGNVLLTDHTADKRMLVSRDVSIALQFCREYRSIEEHADFLIGFMPELGNDTATVQRVLDAVRGAGLMQSAEDAWQRISSPRAGAPEAATPSRVFITTCDRPQALHRLLDSMLANASLVQHERLFVIDDSRDEQNARLNRETVQRFNLSSPKTMEYIGATEQNELLQRLLREIPGHEEGIRFLFDRQQWREVASYGRSRNLCLLLSMEYRALVLDDDVLCSALSGAQQRDGVAFDDGQPEAAFYPSDQHWQHSAAQAPFDPLTGHLRCLGLDLANALKELSPDLSSTTLATADGRILQPLHGGSRVLVTECGSYGDPGTGNNEWVYELRGDSLQRMAEAGGVEAALAGGAFWVGRYRSTFSPNAVMSQITGLDNSAFLPPYFPAHRGEDALFGAMNRYMHPDSVALEYNWAIPHLPLERRQNRPPAASNLQNGPMMLCADMVYEQIDTTPGATALNRLQRLAAFIESFTQLAPEELQALYRRESTQARVNRIRSLTSNLQSFSETPADWRQQVQERLRAAVQALQQAETLTEVHGLPEGITERAASEAFGRYAGGFAAALRAWPAIREAAVSLRL